LWEGGWGRGHEREVPEREKQEKPFISWAVPRGFRQGRMRKNAKEKLCSIPTEKHHSQEEKGEGGKTKKGKWGSLTKREKTDVPLQDYAKRVSWTTWRSGRERHRMRQREKEVEPEKGVSHFLLRQGKNTGRKRVSRKEIRNA